MTTFVLVPGAGGVAWYWHRVVPLLEEAGHEALAVDLPGDDEEAGLAEYAARVVDAIGRRRDVALVAQSLGGFTAPLVCAKVPIAMVVLVNAMIPVPGEKVGDWGDHTGATEARTERPEADRVFADVCDFDAWPPIPIHVIAGRDDRLFPVDFQRRVAQERLHATVDELPGGHLIAFSNPRGLVDQLLAYVPA